MKLIINDKNVRLTDQEKLFIGQKMKAISKFVGENAILEVYLNDIREGDKTGEDKQIKAVVRAYGKIFRFSQKGKNVPSTIEKLRDKLERALRKKKEKRIDRFRRTKAILKRIIPTNWFGGE